MKTVYLSIAMAAAALSFASCTRDDNVLSKEPHSGPFEITITGEMGGFETSTKSSVESVIRMKWNTTTDDNEKDVVYVYGSVNGSDGTTFKSLGSLKATSSEENPYTATLSGTITEMPKDGSLYLVHFPSGTYSEPEVSSDGSVTIDMSAVEQGSDVTPFIICSTVKVSDTDLSGLTARFSFATTVVKVNLTGLEAGAVLTQATVSGLNKTCSLSFSDGVVTVSAAAASPAAGDLGTFTKALSGTATASGNATFLLGVPAMSAASDRQLTVTAGGKTYTDGGVFPGAHSANSYVNTICCLEEAADPVLLPGKFSVSATKKVQFTNGNLWWGVKSPDTEAAWHLEESQTAYPTSWNTNHVGHFHWTKDAANSYVSSYSDGTNTTSDVPFFAESKGGLTVDGQGDLYALSEAEWSYLINSRGSGLYKYGVTVSSGGTDYTNCLIIAPDDFTGTLVSNYILEDVNNSGLVCLPAAGLRDGSDLYNAGSRGYYWSSTPQESYKNLAYYLYFSSGNVGPASNDGRDSGFSVRLVSSVK